MQSSLLSAAERTTLLRLALIVAAVAAVQGIVACGSGSS
jgi:hypothetical protein